MTSSAFGSAASELAVVNAIRNGSRIAFTNVRNGTRIRYDTPPITISAKTRSPTIHQRDQLAEREQDAEPLAADRGGDRREHADRRERHHVAGELEHHLRGALEHVEHRLALGADRGEGDAEEDREDDDLQDVAARHRVDDRRREQVQQDVPGVLLVLHHRRRGLRVGAERQRHAGARLEDVDERRGRGTARSSSRPRSR